MTKIYGRGERNVFNRMGSRKSFGAGKALGIALGSSAIGGLVSAIKKIRNSEKKNITPSPEIGEGVIKLFNDRTTS